MHGIIRRSSTFNTHHHRPPLQRPACAWHETVLHYGDLADGVLLMKLLPQLQPDEIYHLGARTIAVSFDVPEYAGDVTDQHAAPAGSDS